MARRVRSPPTPKPMFVPDRVKPGKAISSTLLPGNRAFQELISGKVQARTMNDYAKQAPIGADMAITGSMSARKPILSE